MSEIIAAAEKLSSDDADVKEKLGAIKGYGKIASGVEDEQVLRQAKLSVVIDRFVAENELDATAIQCWDSIQYNYGCATCLSMSMMGENGLPSACEMDVAGALSMLVLRLASGNASGLS